MRNRLNKMGLEGKTHYKLYKSGRNWIAAGITVFSVGMGLAFSKLIRYKQQLIQVLMGLKIVLLSVLVHQQKLKIQSC